MVGYLTEFEATFNFLKQAPAELKLVIAGNHDITLHKELYLKRLKNKHKNTPDDVDAIRELWTGEEAKKAGIVYLEEGVRTFELGNGATFTVSRKSLHLEAVQDCNCFSGFENGKHPFKDLHIEDNWMRCYFNVTYWIISSAIRIHDIAPC